jgi:F0F1-type ATP synthase delta subunit
LYEEKIGTKRGKLYLAYPMDGELMGQLELKLSVRFQRAVVFDIIYDPDILGGFIFATATERLDASLKRMLIQMEGHLKAVPVG